jgi:hypothetical protein
MRWMTLSSRRVSLIRMCQDLSRRVLIRPADRSARRNPLGVGQSDNDAGSFPFGYKAQVIDNTDGTHTMPLSRPVWYR